MVNQHPSRPPGFSVEDLSWVATVDQCSLLPVPCQGYHPEGIIPAYWLSQSHCSKGVIPDGNSQQDPQTQ